MAVLWLMLKILLWVLLALLALLLVGLVMPVTAELGWSGERGIWLRVRLLGVPIRLLPPKEKPRRKRKSRPKKQKAVKAPAGESASCAGQSQTEPAAGPAQSGGQPTAVPAGKAPEKQFQFTLETVRGLASAAGGFMQRVLARLKIHRIRVYLPVHRQDAAATALTVGRLHAVFGAALGALQNFFVLRFEQYDLVPDYTGEQAGKAFFSCKITAHPIIMVIATVWVLLRLKKQNVI